MALLFKSERCSESVLLAVTGERAGCQSLITIGIRPFGVGMKSSMLQNRCLYFSISSAERSVKSSAPSPAMKMSFDDVACFREHSVPLSIRFQF